MHILSTLHNMYFSNVQKWKRSKCILGDCPIRQEANSICVKQKIKKGEYYRVHTKRKEVYLFS